MEVPSVDPHGHAAELHDDVGAGGECADAAGPGFKDLRPLAGVAADRQWPPDMVQADARAGKRTRQGGHVFDLWMIQPCVEGQIEGGEACETLAERLIAHQVGRRRIGRIHKGRIGIVSGDMADTAEAPAASTSRACPPCRRSTWPTMPAHILAAP